jgi:diguanylate cyclase (GGDEF)-like protein
VQDWRRLGFVSIGMLALFGLALMAPWARLPRRATLVFPLSIWLALAVLGVGAGGGGIATAWGGLFVLSFAYIGLTQARGTALWIAPRAVPAYIIVNGGWTRVLAARLLIALLIWLMLAEMLGRLVQRQAEMTEQLRRAAHTDALTGVANRRDLDLRLATATPGDTIVICDLDHFKRLNDTQGHTAGDRVLADFGTALRACLREHDYAARYGGEEFALVLRATSGAQAGATLARLRERWAILQPRVTFSAGLATCGPDRSTSDTLHAADRALYAAKSAGRDCDRDDGHPSEAVQTPQASVSIPDPSSALPA